MTKKLVINSCRCISSRTSQTHSSLSPLLNRMAFCLHHHRPLKLNRHHLLHLVHCHHHHLRWLMVLGPIHHLHHHHLEVTCESENQEARINYKPFEHSTLYHCLSQLSRECTKIPKSVLTWIFEADFCRCNNDLCYVLVLCYQFVNLFLLYSKHFIDYIGKLITTS